MMVENLLEILTKRRSRTFYNNLETLGLYESVMVFRVFIFIFILFRARGKKEHLDENDFRHIDGNYFKSAILKVI